MIIAERNGRRRKADIVGHGRSENPMTRHDPSIWQPIGGREALRQLRANLESAMRPPGSSMYGS